MAPPIKPDAKFLDMAIGLIEQQTIQFEPKAYRDRYREALEKMLKKKQPEAPPLLMGEGSEKVMDLMEALRKSIEQAKKEKSA